MTGRITMTIKDAVLRDLIRKAPKSAYKRIREFTFQAWISHRTAWLKQLPPAMGRGKKGLKFWQVGKNPTSIGNRAVAWSIPKDRTAKNAADAKKKWAGWNAAVYTSSSALALHESGGTTTSNKRMPTNVRTKIRSPQKWLKKYPNKKIAIVKRGNARLIYEIIGKRNPKYRLRFVLTNKVVNKPILKFHKTWDDLAPVRNQQMRKQMDLLMVDMELGRK